MGAILVPLNYGLRILYGNKSRYHSVRAVYGLCLHPLEHWDRGFESHSKSECMPVLPCVGSGLVRGWSPVQGVLPTASRLQGQKGPIHHWKKKTTLYSFQFGGDN
jgi:hypothetical protein